jgi:hypothetical protein
VELKTSVTCNGSLEVELKSIRIQKGDKAMNLPPMQLTEINGVELEILDSGSGEPVVFVHGAMGDEGSGRMIACERA